jgi:hypothetical protein
MDEQNKLSSNVKRALDLWVELTGVDPNSDKFNMGSWDIRNIHKELNKALELDPTNITCLFMLDYFAKRYLQEKSFTVSEILQDFDGLQKYLKNCHELNEILNCEELQQEQVAFQNTLLSALEHYDIHSDNVVNLIMDSHKIAFVYRDALKSFQDLSAHQFLQGEPETKSPKFNKQIFCFWNINSFIKSVCSHGESGISLCLIKDPMEIHSFFAFGIRNGATVTILTDKPKFAHPRQKYIVRKPARAFDERVARHRFPYQLLDVKFTDDDNWMKSDTKGLVKYQNEPYPLSQIKDLNPDQIIWLIMMFSFIKRKYFEEDHRLPELSYTGEMVQVEKALSESESVKALAIQSYNGLKAPRLTREDMETKKLVGLWDQKPTLKNQWAIDRYGDQVREEIFNLIDFDPEKRKFLSAKKPNAITRISKQDIKQMGYCETQEMNKGAQILSSLDPTEFGNKEKLLKDQKWHARYNQAKRIQMLADQEYKERKDEIKRWYQKQIQSNMKRLLQAAAKNVFMTDNDGFLGYGRRMMNPPILTNICTSILLKDNKDWSYSLPMGTHSFYEEWSRSLNSPLCYLTGGPSTLRIDFHPMTAKAVADLCGFSVDQLPDVIQHWKKDDPYCGNSNLDFLDPMEYVFKDPWAKTTFIVSIYLSKRGYTKLRKDNHLSTYKPWLMKDYDPFDAQDAIS